MNTFAASAPGKVILLGEHAVNRAQPALAAAIDRLRSTRALDELRALTAEDYFAPTRYVLAHVAERYDLPALEITWRSELAVGAGFGSGAAASTAMAFAAIRAAGGDPDPAEIAFLAWQGDVIAHGGVASGFDSGTSALGGVTRYTLDGGPHRAQGEPFVLVVADTGVVAKTADVNTRVRRKLEAHPVLMRLFLLIGLLVEEAEAALVSGDAD